jgi:Zn ribbon nucleic-acid-binding protein
MNYRCPACFMRDLDIDMFYDKVKKEYYCLRCPYTGTEEDVKRLNEQARYRYRSMMKRIKNFD